MPSTKNEEKDAETEKVNEKDQKNDPKTTTLETITEWLNKTNTIIFFYLLFVMFEFNILILC